MEGKFLTRPQRLKVAEQVKKTHFSMGTESNVYSTTSKHCLKAPNDRSQDLINVAKQMKKSNIAFGNEKKSKVSEFTKSYSKKQIKGNKLEIQKIDLKEHHTILGTTSYGYYTTTSGFFKAENSEKVKEKGMGVEKNLRKHHFKLGNDQGVKNSCFKIDYQEKKGERVVGNGDQASGTWNSHFSLGQGVRVYKSTSQVEFDYKPPKSSQVQFRNHSKQNFTFGSENKSLSTTHNQFFIPKPTTPTQFDSKDLRSSHFTLGSFPSSFSQTSSQPIPQSSDFTPAAEPLISIQASHFSLGTDKSLFKTSSNQKNRSITPSAPASKVNTQHHLSSSFSFGNSQTPLSINHHSYKQPVSIISSNSSSHLIKDLKAHHFRLGEDPTYFKTTNSELGIKPGVPGKFEEGLWKDLRNSHFEIGGKGKVRFISVQKQDFCELKMKKEDFSGLTKGLKKSNFANGDVKTVWSTEQKSEFNWIKPVPDNEYKPTPV